MVWSELCQWFKTDDFPHEWRTNNGCFIHMQMAPQGVCSSGSSFSRSGTIRIGTLAATGSYEKFPLRFHDSSRMQISLVLGARKRWMPYLPEVALLQLEPACDVEKPPVTRKHFMHWTQFERSVLYSFISLAKKHGWRNGKIDITFKWSQYQLAFHLTNGLDFYLTFFLTDCPTFYPTHFQHVIWSS